MHLQTSHICPQLNMDHHEIRTSLWLLKLQSPWTAYMVYRKVLHRLAILCIAKSLRMSARLVQLLLEELKPKHCTRRHCEVGKEREILPLPLSDLIHCASPGQHCNVFAEEGIASDPYMILDKGSGLPKWQNQSTGLGQNGNTWCLEPH